MYDIVHVLCVFHVHVMAYSYPYVIETCNREGDETVGEW